MATQTHQLNIKAKLDTSEVRAELERLNQNRGAKAEAGGAQGQGAAQRTTQLLSKLDGTLNRLNSVINRLADVVGAKNYGRLAPISMPPISLPPLALPFDRMNNDQFYSALGQIRAHRPELFGSIAASLSPEEQKVLKYLRPDIFGPEAALPSNRPDNRDFRRQLRSLGLGAISHMAGSQLQSISELMDENSAGKQVVSGFGKFISAAGSGAMAGAAFGPWGAGIGAALMGLSQAAIDTASALKKLEDEALQRTQTARKSYDSAVHGLVSAEAEYRFNSIDSFNIGKYQTTVDSLQKQRIDLLTAIKNETSNPIMDEKRAENLANLQASLQDNEKKLAAYENALAALMQRRAETSSEEEEAGKALARAEREFADELIAEERAMEQWHNDSQSNIKAYRDEQKRYNETIQRGRENVQDRLQRMDFEQEVQMVRLGMWRGGSAADQFKSARGLRAQINGLVEEALTTDNPERLEELQRTMNDLQLQFSHAMMMGQLLKDLGSPLQKLQLGPLTSLANRGVNMGEQTSSQKGYDKKMDEMIDVLQTIEENTRAAEKAVWEQ